MKAGEITHHGRVVRAGRECPAGAPRTAPSEPAARRRRASAPRTPSSSRPRSPPAPDRRRGRRRPSRYRERPLASPAGGPPIVAERVARIGLTKLVLTSPPVDGVVAGKPSAVTVRMLTPEGEEIGRRETSFTSNIDQSVMPKAPLTTGPSTSRPGRTEAAAAHLRAVAQPSCERKQRALVCPEGREELPVTGDLAPSRPRRCRRARRQPIPTTRRPPRRRRA